MFSVNHGRTWWMFYLCYLYLFMHTGVLHYFPIIWCSPCLTVTRQMSYVEQELLTLTENWSSSQFFNGVHVTRSLVLCVCFVDWCFSFCTFSFSYCIVCPSIYIFWLPLWYLRFTSSDYPVGSFKLVLCTLIRYLCF